METRLINISFNYSFFTKKEKESQINGNSLTWFCHCLILIIKVYRLKVFRLITSWVMVWAEDIICNNDQYSLFLLRSGPELCGKSLCGENQNEGALFKPKPSRSHLLIKFAGVTAAEKRSRCFGNVNEDRGYSHCLPPIKNSLAVRVRLLMWAAVPPPTLNFAELSPCPLQHERSLIKITE